MWWRSHVIVAVVVLASSTKKRAIVVVATTNSYGYMMGISKDDYDGSHNHPSTRNCMATGSLLVSLIPSVVKARIATYLTAKDALQWAATSKSMQTDLGLSVLTPPYELLYSQIWLGDRITGDHPRRYNPRIPILCRRSHSIIVSCRWKDQGWGTRQGKLFIVASKTTTATGMGSTTTKNNNHHNHHHYRIPSDPSISPFDGGRVVCESPTFAGHSWTTLQMSFCPRDEELYHLWYVCGNMDGSLLMVEDLVVRTVLFDDPSRNVTHSYQRLCDLGLVRLGEGGTIGDEDDDDEHGNEGFGGNYRPLEFLIQLLLVVVESIYTSLRRNRSTLGKSRSCHELSDILDSFFPIQVSHSETLLETIVNVGQFLLEYVSHQPTANTKIATTGRSISDVKTQDDNSLSILTIPTILNQIICTFLEPKDVANLCRTCKPLWQQLSLMTLSPPFLLIPFCTWEGDSTAGDIPRKVIRIPVLKGCTHTIRLSCRWKDQGFGETKGKLYVVSRPLTQSTSSSSPSTVVHGRPSSSYPRDRCFFERGRVVCESSNAPHQMDTLDLTFSPKNHETYYLFEKAGSGGSHLLYVENLMWTATVFQDERHHPQFEAIYQTLIEHFSPEQEPSPNSIPSKLFPAITRFMRNQSMAIENDDVDVNPISAFLNSHRFRTDEDALVVLEELVELVEAYNNEAITILQDAIRDMNTQLEGNHGFRNHAAM